MNAEKKCENNLKEIINYITDLFNNSEKFIKNELTKLFTIIKLNLLPHLSDQQIEELRDDSIKYINKIL